MRIFALAILLFLFMFTASAFAAQAVVPTDDSTIQEMFRAIVDAFQSGHKLYAGMIALSVAVLLVKKLAPKWKALDQKVHTDVGGAALTLVGSFAAAMVTNMSAGNYSPTWAAVRAALYIAIGAAGGYTLIKKLIVEPILKPLAKKAPTYLQPIFALIFYVFSKPTPVEQADEAGSKAVEEKPATGLGDVKDVE